MVFKDYYKILGFDTNKVTTDEIKNAYREQAKKYHPDINSNDRRAEEIFKDVNEAYKTLSNDKSRRKYDFSWFRYVGRKRNKQTGKEKKTFKELLISILFGNVPRKNTKKSVITPKYGENIVTEINVTLEEAFFGCQKRIGLKNIKGRETSFEIKVPAGVQNNDKIRIIGQGKPGANGGKNGDLLVYIHIKDNKKMRLVGTNLVYEMPLKVWEAALGTTKEILVFGENIKIIVPKLISSGEQLIINEKGYRNSNGTRGKLIIIAKLILPKNINDAEKDLYLKLKNAEESK